MLNALLVLLFLGPSALDPLEAIEFAARAHGRPDIVPALEAVCRRESRCKRIGVHEIDARPDASSYAGQVRLGHLDEQCQPRGDWRRWGTRGIFGLNAADHWEYLPPCYEPEVLDLPVVSAMIAARKYLRRCDGKRTRRWCPRRDSPKSSTAVRRAP